MKKNTERKIRIQLQKMFFKAFKIKQRSPKAKEDTIYNKIFENDLKIHFANKHR